MPRPLLNVPSESKLAGLGIPELEEELLELDELELLELETPEEELELAELDDELLELEELELLLPPDEPEPPQAASTNDTATANPLLTSGNTVFVLRVMDILLSLLMSTCSGNFLGFATCSLLLKLLIANFKAR